MAVVLLPEKRGLAGACSLPARRRNVPQRFALCRILIRRATLPGRTTLAAGVCPYDDSKVAPKFTDKARMTALKTKLTNPCAVASRRMRREEIATSAV